MLFNVNDKNVNNKTLNLGLKMMTNIKTYSDTQQNTQLISNLDSQTTISYIPAVLNLASLTTIINPDFL